MKITDILSSRILLADGAMGTVLQTRGLAAGEVPELWNLSKPDEIAAVHAAYFAAGSDFVLANTFGANPLKMPASSSPRPLGALPGQREGPSLAPISAGVALARRAATAAAAKDGRPRFVGLDIGPTGHLLKPAGDLDFDRAVESFAAVVRAGVAAGADFIQIETMTDTYELKAAVLAAKENCSLPVFATVAFNQDGKLLTGASPEAVVALLEGLRVDVLGMNCGLGPDGMMPLLKRVLACTSVPVMVKPNAGLPQVVDGRTTFNVGPEQFAALVADMARAGARIVGGCCGTTPAHIAALVSRVGPAVLGGPQDRAKPSRCTPATVISSYTRTVTISAAAPVLIGERINPTGKPRLREALKTGDTAYVRREAVAQAEAGAHVLDVNVGVPGLDEAAVMDATVQAVQGV